MSDSKEMLAAIMTAAKELQTGQDNFLRAIAMLAADGRAQIIPSSNGILGENRVMICVPQKLYDRLLELVPANGGGE